MLNIVIEDKNTLYKNGLEALLMEIFTRQKGFPVHITSLTENNISLADIIVKAFQSGESGICHPALRYRKPDSLLIGIYEGDKNPHYTELPLCITNIVFINRAETLSKIKKLIVAGWKIAVMAAEKTSQHSCVSCHHRTLTPQQIKVAAHFYRGDNPEKIADALHISHKTVGAHKRMIMKNFNLDSDCELFHFLSGLKNQKLSPNLFSDCLLGNG